MRRRRLIRWRNRAIHCLSLPARFLFAVAQALATDAGPPQETPHGEENAH